MAIAYIAYAPASTLNQQHLQWEPWPFQVSLTMVMFMQRNVKFVLWRPPFRPYGSWAWGVSNTIMSYEFPWWKSSFEFWNLYHMYGYGNAFASPILPIWLALFAKSTLVVSCCEVHIPIATFGNSPKATLLFGLPNVLWATPPIWNV